MKVPGQCLWAQGENAVGSPAGCMCVLEHPGAWVAVICTWGGVSKVWWIVSRAGKVPCPVGNTPWQKSASPLVSESRRHRRRQVVPRGQVSLSVAGVNPGSRRGSG
jgi:hypothetical protein